MTTTSSFPFSTTEVPLMDDTMEMASPYHGHADDFEIDIDVMEDQASNPDRDMIVADEYMDNSHTGNQGQDGIPDEDMIDDVREPSMIDADDYPEANQNINMQYEEKKTYEAEMLEDEYDEDIDAPVPELEHEAPTALEHADSEEIPRASPTDKEIHEDNNKTTVDLHPEEGIQLLDKSQPKLQPDFEQAADSLDDEHTIEKAETTHVETQSPQELASNTNTTEQTEPQIMLNNQKDTSEDLQNPENKEGGSNDAQSSNGDSDEAEVGLQEEQRVGQEAGQDHGSTENSHLYPVKVYYQDNEISLFPPREGDSSETFFLEDEGLAYESFGNLFVACHEVLQDHINENEALVIDIEALNIQLTEDSRETQNFTLKQIVDVYLQLCHNDGIEGPEALYLTLSTKLTVAAELSDLSLAASEGKGLSEIQSWEVYADAECASAEYEETAQEPYPEEPRNALDDNKGNEGDLEDPEMESTSHDQEAPSPQQDGPETQENQGIENTKLGEVTDNSPDSQARPESPQTASHNSEEQKTESTGTLEPLPATDASEERLETGEVAEYPYSDENNEDEYNEGDQPDGEAHPEETFGPAAGSVDDLEEPEEDDTGDLTEGHPEEYHGLESGYHEQPPSGDALESDASQNNDIALPDDTQIQDTFKTTETTLDENSPKQFHQPQHVVDDSLAVAEDLLKSPVNGLGAVEQQAQVDGASEEGELDETAEHAFSPPAENDEGANLPFEDEDYLDLGIEDDLGDFDKDQDVASTSHISGKRPRELDDELGMPESTTPEVKRPRSS